MLQRRPAARDAASAEQALSFTSHPHALVEECASGERASSAGLRDTAGTSIVEAAIITPLLLLLTLSIVDFGALFYCLYWHWRTASARRRASR